MPHTRGGDVKDFVALVADAIAEVGIFAIENEFGVEIVDFFRHIRADKNPATRDEIALADIVVTWGVIAVPAEMTDACDKGSKAAASAPKEIVFAEIIYFAAEHTGLGIFFCVIDENIDHFRIKDHVVAGAENVFGFVGQKFHSESRCFGVAFLGIVREEMDLGKFLPDHLTRPIGRGIVRNDDLKAGIIDFAK